MPLVRKLHAAYRQRSPVRRIGWPVSRYIDVPDPRRGLCHFRHDCIPFRSPRIRVLLGTGWGVDGRHHRRKHPYQDHLHVSRTATVTAMTPCRVASCDTATFDELVRPLFADD